MVAVIAALFSATGNSYLAPPASLGAMSPSIVVEAAGPALSGVLCSLGQLCRRGGLAVARHTASPGQAAAKETAEWAHVASPGHPEASATSVQSAGWSTAPGAAGHRGRRRAPRRAARRAGIQRCRDGAAHGSHRICYRLRRGRHGLALAVWRGRVWPHRHRPCHHRAPRYRVPSWSYFVDTPPCTLR